MKPVIQDWVCQLSFMQQSVLLSAIRGCDGIPKRHKSKALVRWYRRCVLLSAFEGSAISDPFAPGGGSFTGPIAEIHPAATYDHRCGLLQKVADDFLDSRDELPSHYLVHFMHAAEIVGYKHTDEQIRDYWADIYDRLAKAYHLWPETEEQLDRRLGDNEGQWRERNDRSTSCSD